MKYLIRLLEINNINKVNIIPSAVSSLPGIGSFAEGGNCALGKLDKDGAVPVLINTCDQFTAETNIIPTLLKIDVEGEELNVLKGAKKILEKHHPSILLSTHGVQLRSDCLSFLTEAGYTKFVPINTTVFHRASEFAIH